VAPSRLLAGLCHVFLVLFMVHAGKLEQVINFTIMGGTAKHCIDQYVILFHSCSVGSDTTMPGRLHARLCYTFLVWE